MASVNFINKTLTKDTKAIWVKKISPYKILALTFTKKAANEIKERIKLLKNCIKNKNIMNHQYQKINLLKNLENLIDLILHLISILKIL